MWGDISKPVPGGRRGARRKEVLHPELIAFFVEFTGNFKRGAAGKKGDGGVHDALVL